MPEAKTVGFWKACGASRWEDSQDVNFRKGRKLVKAAGQFPCFGKIRSISIET